MELISETKSFDGWHKQFEHNSTSTQCKMRFAIYLPPQHENKNIPVLYWLSGLTCTDENFMQKAGAHRIAAELGVAIVAPDTSPRGYDVADDPDENYDLGLGAGFYVNATQEPWSSHYNMYDYITEELPELIEKHFNVTSTKAIAGHSMGGHGALTIALKNSDQYTSASAFAPICHPVDCPWGKKAFTAYFGDDQELWRAHDTVCLLENLKSHIVPMRVDQGLSDNFLVEQLKLETLEKVNDEKNLGIKIVKHEGYDHSYYFIASFIEEHLRFHANFLID
ncbi:MAG: S-formylglutathione hydrolase [Gammaproteobacteria bacterium]|nr:S-formylglutathione hydrolase [Gammaproteobacteria bacterium]